MIADIAAVFHWPLETLLAMELGELLEWRNRAVSAWNRMQGGDE